MVFCCNSDFFEKIKKKIKDKGLRAPAGRNTLK